MIFGIFQKSEKFFYPPSPCGVDPRIFSLFIEYLFRNFSLFEKNYFPFPHGPDPQTLYRLPTIRLQWNLMYAIISLFLAFSFFEILQFSEISSSPCPSLTGPLNSFHRFLIGFNSFNSRALSQLRICSPPPPSQF